MREPSTSRAVTHPRLCGRMRSHQPASARPPWDSVRATSSSSASSALHAKRTSARCVKAKPLSVAEVEAVEVGAGQPTAALGQVHGEVHMAAERAEAGVVEAADGPGVAGHGSDGEVVVASLDGLVDDPPDESLPRAAAAEILGDHDGLDLAAG